MAKGARGKENPPADGLKRLKERLTKVSKYPSFPAYLRQEFDGFADVIRLGGPTKWDEIAKWAEEEGYTGGKPLQPATAKRSYEREKQRRSKTGRFQVSAPSPDAAREARLNASDKRPVSDDNEDTPPQKYKWTPTKLK